MRLGSKGTGWLSEKNTYKFFTGYCELSESWRNDPPTDALLKELYFAVDQFKYPIRSNALLKYKILQQSEISEKKPLSAEFYPLIERLRKGGFWLEKSFGENQKYTKSTFLAAQGITYRDGESGVLIRKTYERASVDRSSSSLRTILTKIMSLGSKSDGYHQYLNSLISTNNEIFDALACIHYEVTENIDHWMYYSGNKRCEGLDNKKFGDTLALEVQLKSLISSGSTGAKVTQNLERYLENYPVEFGQYIKAHISRFELTGGKNKNIKSKRLSFLELNYLDNGRGIEQNILNFSSNPPNAMDLKNVIENGISTRTVNGSGLGFGRMVEQTRNTESLFYLRSGRESLSVSGHGPKKFTLRTYEEYLHGTILTIVVPIVSLSL